MTINVLEILIMLVAIAVLANFAEKRSTLRPVVVAALAIVNTGFVLYYTVVLSSVPVPVGKTPIAPDVLNITGAIAAFVGVLATLMLYTRVRIQLVRFFPRLSQEGGYNPFSPMHMTAMVFCVYLFGYTVLNFVLRGGLAGLAADFKGEDAANILTQFLIFMIFAFLGVGLTIRRSLSATLTRLGLRAPTLNELAIGVGMAALLFVAALLIGTIWEIMTPRDVFTQQTQVSQLIANSVTTMFLAFLIAFTAAVGEEIIFRGALQPIFGLWPTAIFFALVHIQYTLTPATAIIVVVAVGLGWLRNRYNTTTSIVAHFLYDFVPLALGVYAIYAPGLTKLIH